MTCGNKEMTLSGGQAIIIGADEASVKEALERDPIPRRQLKTFNMGNGQSIAAYEFSLVSLLPNQSIISNVLQSKETDDRSIANKLYKMAACVMLVTYAHGPYAAGLNH